VDRDAVERLKTSLLEAIQEFCDKIQSGAPPLGAPSPPSRPDPVRVRLATAALLLLMTRADHSASEDERSAVATVLAGILNAGPTETRALVRAAEQDEQLSLPLGELVRLVDTGFSVVQKKQVVESLWRVAFADAEILAHEEYLVRKICDLLHLTQADLIEAKVRAKERFR